jgi:hypoxanthine phosphoribosyltransferase
MEPRLPRMLISEPSLRDRVAVLADEISAVYLGADGGIAIVTVLAGSIVFLADLIRRLPMRMRLGLAAVSAYAGPTTRSSGAELRSLSLPDVRGLDVLIVDDILDTGGTLRLVQASISRLGPRSVRTAVLLRKRGKAPAEVAVDFVGFDIDDVFVVGYGLDYDGWHRNLPYVGVLDLDDIAVRFGS